MARLGIIIALFIFIGALSLISVNFVHLAGDIYYAVKPAGFFSGIVHGIIAPITLILSLFMKINMYELNNIGWWYNFGFLMGILMVLGAGKTTQNVTKNYYYGDKHAGLSNNDKRDIEDIVDRKLKEKKGSKKKEENKKKSWKFWEWQ